MHPMWRQDGSFAACPILASFKTTLEFAKPQLHAMKFMVMDESTKRRRFLTIYDAKVCVIGLPAIHGEWHSPEPGCDFYKDLMRITIAS
jgi:hypothetical protein